MKTRDVYLLSGQTLKDSDTVTFDLTRNLKILYLTLIYSNTNGATSNTVGRLANMVSKLSVVDGSSVLHSLSMDEEQAKNFYDYGRLPYQALTQAAAGAVLEHAIIDFRRFPGDRNFYLDTSRYQNPQLQLTHAFTISATAGFATGDGKLSVIARVIDSGAEANQGYVMAKEIDSFATAASGDHSTDLPLDFPIGMIMVTAPLDGEGPEDYLSNFKLTADTDSFIPINEAFADLLQQNLNNHGKAEQIMSMLAGTSGTITGDIYYNPEPWIAIAANATGYISAQDGNQSTVAAGTSEALDVTVKGGGVKASVLYRFGDGVTAADIFSPQGVGKFQLKLTQSATGPTAKVVTVQQHS